MLLLLPQRYEFSSKSQRRGCSIVRYSVVVATAKVRIFKQITTSWYHLYPKGMLLLLPQRYEFSSKSQRVRIFFVFRFVVVATAKVRIFKQITTRLWFSSFIICCCCYRKGTNFQANHNSISTLTLAWHYRKGTNFQANHNQPLKLLQVIRLLLLPQRYEFSSKSQHVINVKNMLYRCCLEECFYRQAMKV